MKKLKKATAITMAATMALVPMNVLADTKSSEGTVEGEGSIEGWIDTEQYNVTLPTTVNDLSFVIDPQGLTGVTTGESVALDTLTGGVLAFAGDTKMRFTNKSSFDVGVSVHVALESDDTGLKVVSSADAVEAGTERNIYIAAQQLDASNSVVEGQNIPLATSTTEGLAGEKKFAYALADAADQYLVSNTDGVYSFELDSEAEDDVFKTVAFSLVGQVNSQGDWSGYAKAEDPLTMNLEVSYSIDKLGKEFDDMMPSDFVDSTNVPGLLVAETAPAVEVAPSAPAEADFVNAKNDAGIYVTEIAGVSLGKGDLAATGITSIKIGSTTIKEVTAAPTTATTKGYMYDSETGVLTLYGQLVSSTATTADVAITFADEEATKATITLTKVTE